MPPARSENDLAATLLQHLQTTLALPDLDFAEAPSAVPGGYDTAIYAFSLTNAAPAWSGPLILRLFRSETSGEQARYEATVQSAIADQDYPAPRPLHVCEDKALLGGAFMIMERIPGRVMLDILSPMLFRMSALMADTQAALHAIDPAPVLRAIADAGLPPERSALDERFHELSREIDEARLDGLRPALAWLTANRPAGDPNPVICHGDFHPANILSANGAVSGVIDWGWITLAGPAYDVGATTAIFLHGPVDLPAFAVPLAGIVRSRIIARYRKRYEERRPLDAEAVTYFEAMRSVGFLTEAGRHIQARRGVLPPNDKPAPFASPRQLRRIRERIEATTGIPASLPGA